MRMLAQPDLAELRGLREDDEFFWLDLRDPERESLDAVAEVLGIHELALEDTQEFGQRPKLDGYDDQLLLVYYGASIDDTGAPCPVEVHLHITREFVLTVHRVPCRRFDAVREVMEGRPPENEAMLVYRVIDALTDSLLDVLEEVASAVDTFEQGIFRRPRARDRDAMAQLRRHLGRMRRLLVSQRQVFERAAERITAIQSHGEELEPYLRDVGDHVWQALDETEAARDTLQGMLDTYSNEVQERLTIVATIFLPLTALTGFFGMNFTWMINHIGSTWSFFGLGVGGLVVSAVLIMFWLVRSGLYNRPDR